MCGKAQKHKYQKTLVRNNGLVSTLSRAIYTNNGITLTSNVFCAIDMICKTPFIPVKNLPKNNLVKCANEPTAAFESGRLDISPSRLNGN